MYFQGYKPMKLNLGCGSFRIDGHINVDKHKSKATDLEFDLETFPWPWPDNSVNEIVLNHVLEHLGASTETYLNVIKELWRICANNAIIHIAVPHPRHDHFMIDPTHVRAITVEGLALFDQELNRQWLANGNANTPLGIYTGVNFKITNWSITLDEPWQTQYEAKKLSQRDLDFVLKHYNNIANEIRVTWVAVK